MQVNRAATVSECPRAGSPWEAMKTMITVWRGPLGVPAGPGWPPGRLSAGGRREPWPRTRGSATEFRPTSLTASSGECPWACGPPKRLKTRLGPLAESITWTGLQRNGPRARAVQAPGGPRPSKRPRPCLPQRRRPHRGVHTTTRGPPRTAAQYNVNAYSMSPAAARMY
jgi:hypothetical protein